MCLTFSPLSEFPILGEHPALLHMHHICPISLYCLPPKHGRPTLAGKTFQPCSLSSVGLVYPYPITRSSSATPYHAIKACTQYTRRAGSICQPTNFLESLPALPAIHHPTTRIPNSSVTQNVSVTKKPGCRVPSFPKVEAF